MHTLIIECQVSVPGSTYYLLWILFTEIGTECLKRSILYLRLIFNVCKCKLYVNEPSLSVYSSREAPSMQIMPAVRHIADIWILYIVQIWVIILVVIESPRDKQPPGA